MGEDLAQFSKRLYLTAQKVVVKHVDGFSQIKKLLLAKVETIGSIHQINLMRLIGFFAKKCHMLFVYE